MIVKDLSVTVHPHGMVVIILIRWSSTLSLTFAKLLVCLWGTAGSTEKVHTRERL